MLFNLLVTLLLFGCSGPTPKTKVADAKYLIITAKSGMNNDSAVILDVVQIYEEYVWNDLIKLSQSEYFKRKKWVLSKNLRIWTIEVTDDFWSQTFVLKDYQPKCIGTILFASYQNKQADKIKLCPDLDCTMITCDLNEITRAESIDIIVKDASPINFIK